MIILGFAYIEISYRGNEIHIHPYIYNIWSYDKTYVSQ